MLSVVLSAARKVTTMAAVARKGLVLGFYEGEKDGDLILTTSAEGFKNKTGKSLVDLLKVSGLAQKHGKARAFYNLDEEHNNVILTNLGKKGAKFNELEEVDESRENIRIAIAAGVKQLHEAGVQQILVDPCSDPEAAAEGATLSNWGFDELKANEKRKTRPQISIFVDYVGDSDSVTSSWNRGVLLAQGQNLARYLMEMPANLMTPTRFSEIATEKLGSIENVEVRVRDKNWAEEKKMGAFLGVSRGSDEPPKFVEVEYKGGKEGDSPIALVGKGITFDSGGISIKPSANMDEMRADMGGAACVLSSIYTAARLKLPINIIGLMPLCENMPSGRATKPGDVHTSMSGKTIQVDNTDAEGRLILSDALFYAETFQPFGIIDMATLTGAMMIALGSSATGVFTNSKLFWECMHQAGGRTGDRVWRMPLFRHFSKQVTECHLADINNIGSGGRYGGACTAAAFLKEFVKNENWMHMDIAGVMSASSEVPYLCKGMSGRPTRTVTEFLSNIQKKRQEKQD